MIPTAICWPYRSSDALKGIAMPNLPNGDYELVLPSDSSFAARLEWANERYCDLAEDKMPTHVGWLVYNMVIGWTDIGHTKDEVRQLNAVGGLIAELVRSLEES
jgi:hypothetical protein